MARPYRNERSNPMIAQLTTGLHSVDGASIYYEIRGHGPTLLMISGGGGDAGYYSPVADRLADQFTVITYDRRGNSRSTRDADRDMIVAQQSADARSLIEALGTPPAFVFGNSGGAIIALDLAARYPAGLAAVIAHEPPVVHVLPDAAEQLAFFDELQAINRQEGWYPAWLRFAGTIGREEATPTDGGAWDETTFKRIGGNLEFLIAREMQAFIDFTPDIQGIKDGGAR